MVKAGNAVILGIIAAAGIFLVGRAIKSRLPKFSVDTPQEVTGIFRGAGTDARTGTLIPDRTFIPMGNTTYSLTPEQTNRLSLRQKALIGLDSKVPGSFLTRWALV